MSLLYIPSCTHTLYIVTCYQACYNTKFCNNVWTLMEVSSVHTTECRTNRSSHAAYRLSKLDKYIIIVFWALLMIICMPLTVQMDTKQGNKTMCVLKNQVKAIHCAIEFTCWYFSKLEQTVASQSILHFKLHRHTERQTNKSVHQGHKQPQKFSIILSFVHLSRSDDLAFLSTVDQVDTFRRRVSRKKSRYLCPLLS